MTEKDLPETLIFLHMPKTAGTTFISILFRQYSSKLCFLGAYYEIRESENYLASLPVSERQKFKCVYITHAGFGVHRLLPQPSSYVSFLRDPWERTVSDFLHARRNRDHSFYTRSQNGATLDDFVLYRIREQGLTNPMVRLISGINSLSPFKPLPVNALELAVNNINRYFGIVGITERYDETLLLTKRRYGWSNIFYIHRNVGSDSINKDVGARTYTQELFKEANALDNSLYEYVNKQLSELLDKQPADYFSELKQFQHINSIYQSSYNMLRAIKRRAISRL